MGDIEDVDDGAEARKNERASSVEDILSTVREDLGQQSYPVRSEELATTYGDSPTELPNETESLGSAFDRIDDRFDDPEEAYEALVMEFEGGQYAETELDVTPDERATWSGPRADDDRPPADDDVDDVDGGRENSVEHARHAQQQAVEDEPDDGQ